GRIDASAIDSHVLALAALEDPSLTDELRVIDTLGPSTIQPVVVADRLPEDLRDGVRRGLIEMADDPGARPWLGRGRVARFAPADDSSYEDLRRMKRACEEANFLTLR